MPRNPNNPRNPGCGPVHTHTSASENIKLQMMMAKLEDSLKNEFVLKEQLKTINLESLLGSGNIDVKSIDRIEKTSEGLVDTYTIYFNNAEPYSFTVTNGEKGEKGEQGIQGEQGPEGPQGLPGKDGLTTAIKIGETTYEQTDGIIELPEVETSKQIYYLDFENITTADALTQEMLDVFEKVASGELLTVYIKDASRNDVSEFKNYGPTNIAVTKNSSYTQVTFNRGGRDTSIVGGINAYYNCSYSIVKPGTGSIAGSNGYGFTATKSSQKYVTPTAPVSTFRNDANYASKDYVDTAVAGIEIPEAYNDTELRNLIGEKANSNHTHEEYALVDHTHEEYLTAQTLNGYGYATEQYVDDEIAAIQEPVEQVRSTLNTTVLPKVEKVDEIEPTVGELKTWVKNKEYLQEIDLNGYAKLTDLQIGEDFTTDITVGHLEAGFEVKSTMTFGELLKRILRHPSNFCDHIWIDADCTTPKTCSICGQTEGTALGHIEEIMPSKAATCEETGLTEGLRCSRCGEILTPQQVIPALGHKYTSEVTLEPTCTAEGTRTYTCSNGCGETYTEVISALGHNYVSEVIRPATCTEEGLRKYTCTRCGDSYEEVIPKLEHQIATREENRIEPDCTNAGSYDKVTYCTVCGEELSRETIILDALGHNYGDWVITKEPEIGIPGEQTKTCSRCGDIVTEEIPALPAPDEPAEIKYLVGTFGNPDTDQEVQDWPEPFIEDWSTEEQDAISMHYVNNMTEVAVASEDELVGRHGFAITTPFIVEPDLVREAYDVTSENPYMTRPAIILPEGYAVTAWNTDVYNSSLSECTVNSYTLADGRIVYYAGGFPQQTGTTVTHYLTIIKA